MAFTAWQSASALTVISVPSHARAVIYGSTASYTKPESFCPSPRVSLSIA